MISIVVFMIRPVAVAEGHSASTCSSSCSESSSWSHQTLYCGARPSRTLRLVNCNSAKAPQQTLCHSSLSEYIDGLISFRWRACFRSITIAAAHASKLPHVAPSRSLCPACPTLTRHVPPVPPHPAMKAGW